MADTGSVMMPADEAPSEEELLRDHLRRIGENPAGYYAVHIHLSQLRAGNRKPSFIRIAARAFEPLTDNFEATLFRLSNADLALVCRDVPIDEIDPAIDKVRSLFSEDPLTYGNGSIEDRLTSWYDLSQPNDYAAFLDAVRALVVEGAEMRRRRAEERAASAAQAMSGRPLDPSNLGAINQQLEGTRIADLIRRQPAVEVHPGARGRILFHEHYIAMAELQKRVAPGVNLFGSTWLFQYLTETLDKRVLMAVAKRGLDKARYAISLNLNIATVLSREFQQFHRTVGDYADMVIIELQLIDMLSDMEAYAYARDTLHEHGYRVLLDGLGPLALQYFDPGQLGADFVKINWTREFQDEVAEERLLEMRQAVEGAGRDGVILARVESEDAVKWGLGLGIQQFQGRYVDKIVEAMVSKGIV